MPFQVQQFNSFYVLNKLSSHENWINSIIRLPSASLIASASSDQSIRVLDISTNQEIAILENHIDGINCIAFYEESKFLSGSIDKTIKLWDWHFPTKEPVNFYGHDKPVRAIIKLEEDMFASGGGEKIVFIWRISEKKIIKRLPECEDTILTLAKLNGDWLAAGTAKGIIRVFDYSYCLKVISVHEAAVKCILYLQDGNRFVSGGDDNIVSIVNYKQGQVLNKMKGHQGSVMSLVWINCDDYIISGGWDGNIILWDLKQGVQAGCVKDENNYIQSIVYMNDGKTIVTAGSDCLVKVWKAEQIITDDNRQITVNEKSYESMPIQSSNCDVCKIY